MGITQKIRNSIERIVLSRIDDKKVMVEAAVRRGQQYYSSQITYEPKNITEQNLKKWKQAIYAATDPDDPRRDELELFYENLMLDNHLASVIDSRILFCQRSAFKFIDANGTENKELSMLFERPWFDELIYKCLFAKFKGTTLLELYQVNDAGELKEIVEIPQSNFVAQKGIITKEVGDQEGWDYRTDPYKDYYLQIGNDKDLGMLEKLGPIVLAKKLGMGSWLDYIDKFGVPPIFILTDREDSKRLQELYDAGMNFRSNQVIVGRGNEQIQFGEVAGQGITPFDVLVMRADEQISKRVLGGSGLTDEKSFVGSANIQFKLLKDRYESDKLFFKYLFNAEIKPRLIKLSPVYAPLANHTFEWDDTESLTQKELIDTISKLGGLYEIDPNYIEELTGIKIIGSKNIPLPGGATGL